MRLSMGSGRWSTVFFGTALVTLVALALWWTVFLHRSVELEKQAALERLASRAQVAALRLRGSEEELREGPIADEDDLEILRGDGEFEGAFPIGQGLSVRVRASRLAAIEERFESRRTMVIGEGALLFLLIAVCVVMLHRLAFHERRNQRRLEAFVSAFSHELKTPLAGIKSLLQTLASGRVPDDRCDELITMGLAQTNRLQRSIENVLLSGSLRAGRAELSLEPVEVCPLLEEAISQFSFLHGKDRLELRCDDDSDFIVEVDKVALRVIFENLVDNGIKYGGDAPLHVNVCGTEDGRSVEIEFRDRGVGFRQRDVESFFQPFQRGEQQRQRGETQTPGSGLGLFIVRALSRKMDGELLARSDGPGQGASFVLRLPLTNGL